MAREGRVQGRVSSNGGAYELVQFGEVRQSIPIAEAYNNQRLQEAIRKNNWQALP
jgi:hypothetical protein